MITRLRTVLMAVVCVIATACSTVQPGTVVLEVPLCNEGATPTVQKQGRYFDLLSPCTDYYTIPSREQRAVWAAPSDESAVDESITFAGKDGQAVNVDVSVGYQISENDSEILAMVKTFGYDVGATIHGRVRDSARNALNMCASHMGVEEIYGEGKEKLFACATEKVTGEFNPKGLYITRLTLNSEVRLPAAVKEALVAASAATQQANRILREVESTTNEGKKKVAEAEAAAAALRARSESEALATVARAEAEAKANRLLADSLTPSLIKLKELEIEKIKAAGWKGDVPDIVAGAGSDFIFDARSAAR